MTTTMKPKTVKTASAFVKLCKETAKISAQIDTLKARAAKVDADMTALRVKRLARLEDNLRMTRALRTVKVEGKLRNLTAKLIENTKAISTSNFK